MLDIATEILRIFFVNLDYREFTSNCLRSTHFAKTFLWVNNVDNFSKEFCIFNTVFVVYEIRNKIQLG